jgi:hypothetical protein
MTTRSQVVLQVASALVSDKTQPYNQAKVLLRVQGGSDWPLCLFGTSTIEGVHALVNREADLTIINPAAALGMAVEGRHPFTSPQPVRSIGVIPSQDGFVFAVRPETGLTCVEDIAKKKYPLKISLRSQLDHWVHIMLDHILSAAGCTLDDICSWGGSYDRKGPFPFPDGPRFKALVNGEITALFDEASDVWCDEAAEAGCVILPLLEPTVQKLEAIGYRRGYLRKSDYPHLPQDILTLNFSGWPILVHADASDELVARICKGLDERRDSIAWQGVGPLPVERMCLDAPDTPQHAPLHLAAERFWRERGYLK